MSRSLCIAIPTHGRALSLRACLESINDLGFYKVVDCVLVVDNNSDPAFNQAVESVVDDFNFVSLQSCPSPGLTAARHFVLDRTSSEIICFLDDDVVLSPDWLESIVYSFNDDNVAISGGPSIPNFQCSIPAWFWEFVQPTQYGGWMCPWLSLLDIGMDVNCIDPNFIWGLNFAIRRTALINCGGFHIDLVPPKYMRWQGDGETGLTIKLASRGYSGDYRQDSLVYHQCGPERLNPDYFAKRAFYQGVCNSYTELRRNLTRSEDDATRSLTVTSNPANSSLRRFLAKLKRRICSRSESEVSRSTWGVAAAEVRARCQQAEREGFLFHQMEAAADPALRKWICRDNYFNVDLRDNVRPDSYE